MIGGLEHVDESSINTIEIYDPTTDIQHLSPIKLIQARYNHRAIVYQQKLYVFAGSDGNGVLNSVKMFSSITNEFVMITPLKIARDWFGCCRVDNFVYIIGGFTRNGITRSVEVYDLERNSWSDGVDFPYNARMSYACTVSN